MLATCTNCGADLEYDVTQGTLADTIDVECMLCGNRQEATTIGTPMGR